MRIAIFAPPGVQSLDVVGPAEVFWDAARRIDGDRRYTVEIVGARPDPILGTGGVRFLPDRTIEDGPVSVDTLLIGGDPTLPPVEERVAQWIAQSASTARRVGSICTGAFLLGAAGLLEGRRVTTHWECAAELRRQYPTAMVESDSIFVRDGPVFTAAGVSAGMDLALALVEEDHGRGLALAVARYMVMFLKRPGGQSQFSAHLAAQLTTKPTVQSVQEHILEHLGDDLSIDRLADLAGMSPRNFTRVFSREVGMTATEFVQAARIDAARRLLEDSPMPLKWLAYQCGFGTAHAMRRAFVRTIGVTPQDYRIRFRSAWAESHA